MFSCSYFKIATFQMSNFLALPRFFGCLAHVFLCGLEITMQGAVNPSWFTTLLYTHCVISLLCLQKLQYATYWNITATFASHAKLICTGVLLESPRWKRQKLHIRKEKLKNLYIKYFLQSSKKKLQSKENLLFSV